MEYKERKDWRMFVENYHSSEDLTDLLAEVEDLNHRLMPTSEKIQITERLTYVTQVAILAWIELNPDTKMMYGYAIKSCWDFANAFIDNKSIGITDMSYEADKLLEKDRSDKSAEYLSLRLNLSCYILAIDNLINRK